jgi:hypothetical protein
LKTDRQIFKNVDKPLEFCTNKRDKKMNSNLDTLFIVGMILFGFVIVWFFMDLDAKKKPFTLSDFFKRFLFYIPVFFVYCGAILLVYVLESPYQIFWIETQDVSLNGEAIIRESQFFNYNLIYSLIFGLILFLSGIYLNYKIIRCLYRRK